MGAIVRATIFMLAGIIAGCAPSPPPVSIPRPVPPIPLHPDYERAAQAFADGEFTDALAGYNDFLRRAYDDPYSDLALFNIGQIFRSLGRDNDALAVYSRLIREFPQSERVPAAWQERLAILYAQGRYRAVIRDGGAVVASTRAPARQLPLLAIIADAYHALGDDLASAHIRYQIWRAAPNGEKAAAWTALNDAVDQLRAEDLQQLMVQVTERPAIGLMLYRLGMAFILDENYDGALDVLNAFVARFPDHPDYQDAADMVLSLEERARFTPFTVGCVLPLSGAYAVFGQRALNGIELALSQIGAAADGIPFRLMIKDSRSDPTAGVAAVEAMDREKVGAILGPMSSAEEAASAAQSGGIPIIVFTQREGVPDIGAYVFRNFITPSMQVRALVAHAVGVLKIRRFAILYPDENYGRRYMNLFWDQVIAHGGVVNAVEAYDPAGTDFAQPIKKLAGLFFDPPADLRIDSVPTVDQTPSIAFFDAAESTGTLITDPVERFSGLPLGREVIDDLTRPRSVRDDRWHPAIDYDAIFIPDAPKKAGLVIPQLAFYDIRDVYLLGTNLWNSPTLLEMSGEYMQWTLIVDGFFAASQSPRVREFVTAFQNTYDRTPGIVEAVAYDSAMLLLQTMRRTATDSRRDLKAALLELPVFEGVSGKTRFTPSGEADKQLVLLTINRDRLVEADPGVDAVQTVDQAPSAGRDATAQARP